MEAKPYRLREPPPNTDDRSVPMHHPATGTSPRDELATRIERTASAVSAAADEAYRVGYPGLNEDLNQIWFELLRCAGRLSDPPHRYLSVRDSGAAGLRPAA